MSVLELLASVASGNDVTSEGEACQSSKLTNAESGERDLPLESIGKTTKSREANPLAGINSYHAADYHEEKLGEERAPGGVQRLKKLRPKHRQIIKLSIEGLSNAQIARKVGKSYGMVYQTLNDPLAKAELEIALAASRHQLQALQIAGVEAIGGAIRSELPETQLKGVDRLLRMQELVGLHTESRDTAEDVAQKLLAAIQVNVNVVNDGRVTHIDRSNFEHQGLKNPED